jgi:hypothetical protein
MTAKRIVRVLAITAVAGVLAVGAAAPLINANRFQNQIQEALRQALGRKVTIGGVRFTLFTGPGFSVRDVLIEEDPNFGVEPFAHVESLEARLRLSSLWTGRLAFSSLRLLEPSVNLVKADAGGWNIQPLLSRTSVPGAGARVAIPEIQISAGRLNIKFGDTKSIFYISNADVSVYPNEAGDLIVRFSGEPARTDRGAQGLGRLVARGAVRSRPGREDELEMGVQLERTSLSELVRLFDAHEIGVHGFLASNMQLSGPLSRVNISGNLKIDDLHRWDLMPAPGEGWTLNYAGTLELRAQRLTIEARAPEGQPSPVGAKFQAADYLSAPKWLAAVTLRDLPASSLLETARHMGAPFPPGVELSGKVNGEIGYSKPDGLRGNLLLTGAAAQFPQAGLVRFEVVRFEAARVWLSGEEIGIGPSDVQLGDLESAMLEARYAFDSRSLWAKLNTRELNTATINSGAARALAAAPVPLLAACRQGAWKGWITFERQDDRPGVWTGDYELQNAAIDLPGLAQPLRVTSANVQMQAGQVQISRMRAHIGRIALEGDYRYSPSLDRPDRLRLVIMQAQLTEIERLLTPTLGRQEGLLAKFRLRRAPPPEWLKDRQLEGSLRIRDLRNGETRLGDVRARLVWNGASVQLANIDARLDDMQASGELSVNLADAAPEYQLAGRIANLDYRGGKLDLEGRLETSGVGLALAVGVRSEGMFRGREITLAPDLDVEEISGSYRLDSSAGAPRLELANVELARGPEILRGQGFGQPDGRVVLDLFTAGRKPVRLTGMLLPLHPAQSP